jgi:hypothetical protein
MPIPRISDFHWVGICVRDRNSQKNYFYTLKCKIERGSYQDMKAQVLDGVCEVANSVKTQ